MAGSSVGSRLFLAVGVALLAVAAPSFVWAQADLLGGFGGPAGFGSALARNDDGSVGPIDLGPAFPAGVNFYDREHHQIWLNNNGNVTFAGAVVAWTPEPFPASPNPMIAPFWGDVDTRGTTGVRPEENLAYYYVDRAGGRFIGTWYNVGYYSMHNDRLNSFQVILTNRGDIAPGDFDIEFRYNRCEWVLGDASGGIPAQTGFDAGDGAHFWSHPDSRTPAIVNLCATSNVGIPGVWRFQVRGGGAPQVCGDGILAEGEECDDGNLEPNDGCTDCVEYSDNDHDGFYGDVDCDDTDRTIHPEAVDLCDGIDNDCDGDIDDGLSTDADGDGHYTPESCAEPHDDCDDDDPTVYPGAEEVCDGLDNDCNGTIDDGLSVDEDGDGHYTPGSCAEPHDDCDDTNPERHPAMSELCDGIDNDCDGVVPPTETDGDGDGFAFCDGDCDETNPRTHPGAEEICDGLDNDCDPDTDENADGDGDGFSVCDGDCDDADPEISPDAVEVCDGLDNDCDPDTDENADGDGDGFSICDGDCDDADPTSFPGAEELCDGIDNDCDGVVPADEVDDDEDGQMICGGDCDDADPTVGEGFPELCDGIDNDCDGDLIGETEDEDGDGLTPCEGDCDDTNADSYPGAEEICDGFDNDCDGEVPADEVDEDGDGALLCGGDCDDADPTSFPGAEEICDGIDNDCDGEVPADELDGDGDGFTGCEGDCDDTEPTVFPGAEEVCDGLDNDCDGNVDAEEADTDGDGFRVCDGDCDDGNPEVYPGAPEINDGKDNDCNGELGPDEGDDGGHDEGTGCDCRTAGSRSGVVGSLVRLILGWLVG